MKKTGRLLPETGRSQATNLERQKQTNWIEMQQSQVKIFFLRSANMIDRTEKPKIRSKFAKHPARYNEFGYKISINVYFIRGNSTVSRCIILQALAYLFVITGSVQSVTPAMMMTKWKSILRTPHPFLKAAKDGSSKNLLNSLLTRER